MFRPHDFVFPYKRTAYQAPLTPTPTIISPLSNDPAGEGTTSDLPPPEAAAHCPEPWILGIPNLGYDSFKLNNIWDSQLLFRLFIWSVTHHEF
jgi:hypothetical protein